MQKSRHPKASVKFPPKPLKIPMYLVGMNRYHLRLIAALMIAGAMLSACMACSSRKCFHFRKDTGPSMSGTDFYRTVAAWHWKERDSLAVRLVLSGDVPK